MLSSKLTKIGVFYDGNYFLHVSNYYAFNHARRARIDVSGLHQFIRRKVSELEGTEERYCHIVDAHYFRGRLRAQFAEERDLLLKERVFDDILSREGITNHYLPVGPAGEKGIDVWLALEAYELALYKRFDVIVLIAGDGDFLPLVRKLNTIGTRVMLLGWDFSFVDKNGTERETKTSQALLEEATYPVLMQQIIDDRSQRDSTVINGMFIRRNEHPPRPNDGTHNTPNAVTPPATAASDRTFERERAEREQEPELGNSLLQQHGRIQNLKDGFGFITPAGGGSNLFFFHAEVRNADFNELNIGDMVYFKVGTNDKGSCAVDVRLAEVNEQP